MKTGATAGIILSSYGAIVAPDNGFTDRKTKPQTLGFGGEKRLEQFLDHPRLKAAAGIRYAEMIAAARPVRAVSGDGQGATLLSVRFHGINRIHDQVEKQLLKLNLVTPNGRKVLGNRHHQLYPVKSQFLANQA